MLAHSQGGLLNAAALASGLGVDGKTVARYLDLLVDLLLVRRLQPWHRNAAKGTDDAREPQAPSLEADLSHVILL